METKPINNLGLMNPTNVGKDKLEQALEHNKAKAKGKVGTASANTLQAEEAASSIPTAGNYDVNVSSAARSLAESRAKALDIARNTPDVREDRVAELRKRIKDGTYKVSSEGIADGILKEAVRDELAMSMHQEAKERN